VDEFFLHAGKPAFVRHSPQSPYGYWGLRLLISVLFYGVFWSQNLALQQIRQQFRARLFNQKLKKLIQAFVLIGKVA
jgi:hypothetical protein